MAVSRWALRRGRLRSRSSPRSTTSFIILLGRFATSGGRRCGHTAAPLAPDELRDWSSSGLPPSAVGYRRWRFWRGLVLRLLPRPHQLRRMVHVFGGRPSARQDAFFSLPSLPCAVSRTSPLVPHVVCQMARVRSHGHYRCLLQSRLGMFRRFMEGSPGKRTTRTHSSRLTVLRAAAFGTDRSQLVVPTLALAAVSLFDGCPLKMYCRFVCWLQFSDGEHAWCLV